MMETIIQYAVPVIWTDLTADNFKMIDIAKWNFLKLVLGVSKHTISRLVALMTDELPTTLRIIDLLNLEHTVEFDKYDKSWLEKK
ncbi:hypothetical protein GJ496_011942 [Pomphorhynchus laevis]|nr:hypothetical protein GJ496_011942 [Pomphorhynchus laevis]